MTALSNTGPQSGAPVVMLLFISFGFLFCFVFCLFLQFRENSLLRYMKIKSCCSGDRWLLAKSPIKMTKRCLTSVVEDCVTG